MLLNHVRVLFSKVTSTVPRDGSPVSRQNFTRLPTASPSVDRSRSAEVMHNALRRNFPILEQPASDHIETRMWFLGTIASIASEIFLGEFIDIITNL